MRQQTAEFNRAFSLFLQELVRHGLGHYEGIENEFEGFMDRGGQAPMADWEDHQGSVLWLQEIYPELARLYWNKSEVGKPHKFI